MLARLLIETFVWPRLSVRLTHTSSLNVYGATRVLFLQEEGRETWPIRPACPFIGPTPFRSIPIFSALPPRHRKIQTQRTTWFDSDGITVHAIMPVSPKRLWGLTRTHAREPHMRTQTRNTCRHAATRARGMNAPRV